MTREEAIAQLNVTLWLQRDQGNHYFSDALAMAIKALEQQPCEDCISREEVIQIIENKLNPCTDMFKCLEMSEIKEDVEHLPSVTPIIPEVENNYNIGYNCGYADAMSDVADMRGKR